MDTSIIRHQNFRRNTFIKDGMNDWATGQVQKFIQLGLGFFQAFPVILTSEVNEVSNIEMSV